VRAQYPDAFVVVRRVNADIGNVEIESNEDAILGPSGSKDTGIGAGSDMFVEHGVHIVTSVAQEGFSVTRDPRPV
jgi:hypothetical protein